MLEKALCAVYAGRFFDVKNKYERGVFMYPVSEAFLTAVQENTRSFYWTGRITTKTGAVYAAEMGLTLLSEIGRYTLEDGKIELFYHLLLGNGTEETVPMGIFEISEANWTIRCLEIKAYDYMLRFERSFNGFETVGNAYAFLVLCCKACKVELAHTQAEIEAMLNGSELLSVYTENDIETYRDVLFYVGQVLGGFFYINREGKLELHLCVNPLLQFGLEETRKELLQNILRDLSVIRYVSFDSDTIGNPALDLGDVLVFTGGHADGSQLVRVTWYQVRITGNIL